MMSMVPMQADPSAPSDPLDSGDDVLAQNEMLRQESQQLIRKLGELNEEIGTLRLERKADRHRRLAALNLMEDAVAARRAEQRENAERRRVEIELRASEAKYRSLFESIDEGFLILEKVASPAGELDFRFVEANPAVAQQCGAGSVVGKCFREAFPGESGEWLVTFDAVLATGVPVRFERELVTHQRILELYAFRPDKTQPRVAVIFKDVTQRRAAETRLRDADRRKDEFLATLAHELRNPLAPILNSLNILRLKAGSDPTSERICEMMERQANHVARLVDDLMEVSRITRGSIDLHKEETDLATVVHSAVETSQPLIDAGGHRLEVELPKTPVPLYGDAVRLAQIFANLLNNAAKYTDPGGRIWVSAKLSAGEVAVTVRDNGIGISAPMLPAVFEMFNQVDGSRGRSQGGLGIGLTLAKSLVELHDGTITARSGGAGQGTEFTVRLPLRVAPRKATATPKPGPLEGSFRRRVLVVDDNDDAAACLALLLRFLGCEVQIAHEGKTALNVMPSFRPEIVFLDIGMPGMDGCEVARRIRQRAEFNGMVLIALTGWGQAEDREKTHAAGFNHHLVKPADITALQALLSSVSSA
jgi:signal transduction histidine kinase/CheY-like chemotaxis protein